MNGPIPDGLVWVGDRPWVMVAVLVFVAVLFTALVTLVFSDASMRHFVADCTSDGGRVEVVQRALVCLGGGP